MPELSLEMRCWMVLCHMYQLHGGDLILNDIDVINVLNNHFFENNNEIENEDSINDFFEEKEE